MIKRRICGELGRTSVSFLLYTFLTLDAFLLVFPKLILITFTNDSLWGNIGSGNFAGAVAQDVFVAIASLIVCRLIIQKVSWKSLTLGGLLAGSILFLLMIDMRVRELWLKPIDVSLVVYAIGNATDLTSGRDIFFKFNAGFGMTFQRMLFFVGILHLVFWSVISWSATRRLSDPRASFIGNGSRWRWILLASAGCGILSLAMMTGSYRYRMNENIMVSSIVGFGRNILTGLSSPQYSSVKPEFEQRAKPLSNQMESERTIVRTVKPFKNVVFVVYESIRWRSVGVKDSIDKNYPTLSRLASEGMLSQSYVSVPHSSKAYFSILSGRYPFLAVEMRESLSSRHASIWHEFTRARSGTTFAFSSLFFGFENMGGLLKALGIDKRYQTDDLARAQGRKVAPSTSFGSSDDLLYHLSAEHLEKAPSPFAAFFFPLAAHYPYECPGSGKSHSYLDYEICLKYSDKLLGEMIDEFRRRNLMQDTLFVVVGDHGESFGEHGLYVHNSSMYQEEVTVPLVFWSEDGRLAQHFLPASREIDIAPTVADLLGLMNSEIPVQGISLLRRGDRVPPIFMSTFFEGVAQGLVEPPLKYIYEEGADRLLAFNLDRDPNESSPEVITGDQKNAIVNRLRAFKTNQDISFPAR